MTKLKIALILLSCILRVLTENPSSEPQAQIDNVLKPHPEKIVLQQFSHVHTTRKEEPSFMSKVASWIFPFGGTNETPLDSAPSETQQRYAPQYLPPSQHGYSKQPCNPCNREPWIPVAGNHGQNTVIGFVQQSHLQNQGYIPSSNAYELASSSLHNFHPPPLVPQNGLPIPHQYGPPPPQQQHVGPSVHPQYGIPREHYGVPTNIKPVYDQPPENFGAPVQHFIPPPLPKHATHLFKNIGLPSQKLNPSKQGFPSLKHGVLKLGPSKFRLNSPPQHGPPIPLNFGKPQLDKYKFSLPPSGTKSPLLSVDFEPPSVGTHSVKIYAPTHANQGVLLQPPPYNVDYITQPLPITYQASSGSGISSNYQLSSILPQNYDASSLSISSANVDQNLLSGSRYNYPTSNSGQFGNGGPNKPIPFPGLSFQQIGPLHESRPFQTGFSSSAFHNLPQHDSKVKIQTNNEQSVQDVQVIPSIRVADYLASVDHPINVIQSPLVEVIATENKEPKDSGPGSGYANNNVQLSENPIVVDSHDEDTHAAATAQNLSYYNPIENEKLNNEKYVETSLNFDNKNLESNQGSSAIETLNSGFSDEQLRTILQSQKSSEDLSLFNVNFAKYLDGNKFSQTLIRHTQNQNESNNYNGFENQFAFTQPPTDYSNWTPTFGTLSTSMVPPPLAEPVWNMALASRQITSTTQKPKQVQIIIPYISNNPPPVMHSNKNLYKDSGNIRGSKEHQANSLEIAAAHSSPSLPLYTQPPSIDEPVWSHYVTNYNQQGLSKATVSTERSISAPNIRDLLLKEEQIHDNFNKPPFDIIRLQKNIDNWTEQEFSTGILNTQKASTSAKFVPSKKIPSEYLTTQPYNKGPNEVTTIRSIQDIFYDHEAAGSQTKISKVESNEDIDTNFILTETPFSTSTTTELLTISTPTLITNRKPLINVTTTNITAATAAAVTTTESSLKDTSLGTPGLKATSAATPKPMWEKLQVSISPLTKEKVYVVTPQPWKFIPKEINEKLLSNTESSNAALTSAKFSVVIQPEGNKRTKELPKNTNGELHIVYSEWPHLINNLQTTTTTEKPKTTNHPLFGLMDLSSYTPPPNSAVETYGGHSRVITVVTPTSVTKNNINEKKTSTTKTIPLAVGRKNHPSIHE